MEDSIDNGAPSTQSQSAEIFARFNSLARWKAHDLKFAHRELEDAEALDEAMAALKTWQKRTTALNASIQEYGNHEKFHSDSDWPDDKKILIERFVNMMRRPPALSPELEAERKTAIDEGSRLMANFMRAYNFKQKVKLWTEEGLARDLAEIHGMEDYEEVGGDTLLMRAKGKFTRFDSEHKMIFGNLAKDERLGWSHQLTLAQQLGIGVGFAPEAKLPGWRPEMKDERTNEGTLFDEGDTADQMASKIVNRGRTRLLLHSLTIYSNDFEEASACRLYCDSEEARADVQAATGLFEDFDELSRESSKKQIEAWIAKIGAKSFVDTYWLGDFNRAKIEDIQTSLQFKDELLLAFEGNKSLGVASIALGSILELLPKGNLPQRCFERLQADHGLTKGAWKLFSQIEHPEKFWQDAFGSSLAGSGRSDLFATDSFSSAALSLSQIHNLVFADDLDKPRPPQKTPEQILNEEAAHSRGQIQLLCDAANAASSYGVDPAKLAEFIKGYAKSKKAIDAMPGWSEHSLALMDQWAKLARSGAKPSPKLRDCMDYMRHAEADAHRQLEGLAPEACWKALMGLSSRWHQMIAEREKGERCSIRWEPLAADWPKDDARGLSFVELCDGGELYDEGKAMHHCVSTYSERCQAGDRRILSMRADGERAGTLELVKEADGSWSRGQFKRGYNKDVKSEAANELADRAVEASNQARLRALASIEAASADAGNGLQSKIVLRRAAGQQAQEQDRAADVHKRPQGGR